MYQMNVVHGSRDTVLQRLADMQCRYQVEKLIIVPSRIFANDSIPMSYSAMSKGGMEDDQAT
jgi:hypothetical protein